MAPPSVTPRPASPGTPASSSSPVPPVPQRSSTPPDNQTMPPRYPQRETEDMLSNVDPPVAPTPPKTPGAMSPLPTNHPPLKKMIIIASAVILLLTVIGSAFWYIFIRPSKELPPASDMSMLDQTPSSSITIVPPPEPSAPFPSDAVGVTDTPSDATGGLPVP